jgi:lipid II:glycine glycyltransferase (peptidoglycan interpeptide bridge formation enzyme)
MSDENGELRIAVARLEERLKAADQALELARESLERWQAASNEWRKENIDQRNLYPTTDKVNAMIAAIESRVATMEKAGTFTAGKHGAFGTVWAAIAGLAGIIAGSALTALLTKLLH